ncbi:MAG: type II toxin-antitoxin system VapC family toxin [Gammaproteobacteria bacterium]|nr:type II toxin-antitoxin system VapC family toxin [Gammaproteobacteria bacterium]MBQ0839754.1 type II toxin-antitoxin system VapC family toxin [Gammaproteobacteria bacterium]
MILLDTHVLVWLSEGSHLLGSDALALIDSALKNDELFVLSISFWEVAMLVEKKRLSMDVSVPIWRSNLLSSGLQELPLTGCIAIESAQLPDFHGDPADRMIVAAAINSNATLCTADQKILAWEHDLIRLSAKQ